MLNRAAVVIFTLGLLHGAAAAAEGAGRDKELPSLIVFDMVPEKGVEKGAANLLTELIMDRVAGLRRYEVIGQKDMEKLVLWEQNKQLAGCTDTSCLAQIAGAMGAKFFIEGSVGVMGDQYIVTLKLMDVERVKVLKRKTEQVAKDEGELVKAVKRMVDAIMGVKQEEEPRKEAAAMAAPAVEEKIEAPRPGGGYRLLGKIGVFGGIGAAALGGLFAYLASKSAGDYEDAATPAAMERSEDRRLLYNKIAVGSFAAGGLLAAGGAVLWWVMRAPAEEAGTRSAMLLPAGDEGGYGVSVRWRW